ncbi:MAG: RHS repeat-associated core domain-containing protein [Parachlamydiales bacterium]|nr:RHS repeat-associated core domain-containing protein [Parachlamydiales bacterium]
MVRKLIYLLNFLFFPLLAIDTSSILSSLEGHVDMITPYSVNIAGGDFISYEVDAVIECPEPIAISRFNDSNMKTFKLVGGQWLLNTHCNMHEAYKDKYGILSVPEMHGGCIKYKRLGNAQGRPFGTEYNHTTNNSSGFISGQTNYKNNYLHPIGRHKDENWASNYELRAGDGSKRFYVRNATRSSEFHLDHVEKSNGNSIHYFYDGQFRVTRIETRNSQGQVLGFANYIFNPYDTGYRVELSDGRTLIYDNVPNPCKTKYANYLKGVERPELPSIKYQYKTAVNKPKYNFTDLSTYYFDDFSPDVCDRIAFIHYPNNRFLKNEYYHKDKRKITTGRVKRQLAPVGTDATPIEVAHYEYNKNEGNKWTNVYDAYNKSTLYHMNIDDMLLGVKYMDRNKQLIYQEHLIWGPRRHETENCLVARTIADSQDRVLIGRLWNYDSRGNVLEETIVGNLTGHGQDFVEFDRDHKPIINSNDTLTTKHTYSDNGFNQLLSTTDFKGVTTEFGYQINSNHLVYKLTRDPSGLFYVTRDFYDYDIAGQVLCHMSDDGSTADRNNFKDVTERKIVRNWYNQFGKIVQTTTSCLNLSTGQEMQLIRKTIDYNDRAKPIKESIFDANDELAAVSYMEYDHKSRLIKEIDPLNRVITHEYDENHNEILRSGPCPDFKITMIYDFSNRLIREDKIYPDLTLTTTYTYDYLNNCTSITDPFGYKITHEYDAFSRVIQTNYPTVNGVVPTTKKTYNELGYETSSQDTNGYITTKTYTALGKPVCITNPDGSCQKFTYNTNSSVATDTNTNGSTTYYTYDCLNRVLSTKLIATTGEILDSSSCTYNTLHLLSKTDGNGIVTKYTYDYAGRLSSEITPTSHVDYLYDPMGRQYAKKLWSSPDDYQLQITVYNAINQVLEERTEDSQGTIHNKTTYQYDISGNCIQTTTLLDADRTAITYKEYNARNEIIKTTDTIGNVSLKNIEYVFDGLGISKIVTETDPLGLQTISTYNAYDKAISVEIRSLNLTLKKQRLSYDTSLNLSAVEEDIYDHGQFIRTYVVRFEYGPNGRKEKEINAYGTSNAKTTFYTYDNCGRLAKKIKPNGVRLIRVYDEKGRIKDLRSSSYPKGEAIHYEFVYDCNDNLLSSYDYKSNITTIRTFENNQLISEKMGHETTLRFFSYDLLNRTTAILFHDGSSIDYVYSPIDLQSITRTRSDGSKSFFNITKRSATGKCQNIQTPVGDIETSYDALDRITSIKSNYFNEDSITYDSCHNIKSLNWQDAIGTVSCNYAYDELYQLTHEDGLSSHTVNYDSLNNRLKSNNETYITNVLNQYTQVGDTQLVYDDCGNLVGEFDGINTTKYVYDALDQLVEINFNNKRKAEYTYDSFHRRIAKHVLKYEKGAWVTQSSLYFLFDELKEIGSFDENEKIVELRVLSTSHESEVGATLLIELDQDVYYPINDHRGCIVSLVDSSGKSIETYRYGAFGEEKIYDSFQLRVALSPLENPWRFSFKRYDEESDLTYFGRRYYSANFGRWITQDPEGYHDGYNLYAYLHNRSLSCIDPWGLAGEWFNAPANAY